MIQGAEPGQNRLPTPPNASVPPMDAGQARPASGDETVDAPNSSLAHSQEHASGDNASPPSPQSRRERDDAKPVTDAMPHNESVSAPATGMNGEPKPEIGIVQPIQPPGNAVPPFKSEPSAGFLREIADAGSASRAETTAAAVAALNAQAAPDMPPVRFALLLEAASAEQQQLDPEVLRKCAEDRAETDKYITDAIHRVQTTPRDERSIDLRPLDRRDAQMPPGWSRFGEIKKDAQLLGECRRLVRGTQGCGRECDAKFTNLIDFAKHVDQMHDVNFRPFLCPQDRCPWGTIGFHERSECTRHIRTKHYRAMYACEYQGCTKVYNRSDAFRRHVRQAHANPGSRFNRLTQRPDDSKN